LYKGKYDPPTGLPPVVQETGAYSSNVMLQYDTMAKKLAVPTRNLINYVNTMVWQDGKIYPPGSLGFPAVLRNMIFERGKIINTPEFLDLKKALENTQ
jgi:hypothetical protein